MSALAIINLILPLIEVGTVAYVRIKALSDKMEAEGREDLTDEERNMLADKTISVIDDYLNS